MTKILIHSNHFRSSPDNLGTYNNQPITMQEPGIDWQNNEFNITPPAKLKVPVYVRGEVDDIGDVLRFHWKDGYTGKSKEAFTLDGLIYASIQGNDLGMGQGYNIIGSVKKKWNLFEINTEPMFWVTATSIRIRIYNNDPAYTLNYGFHICLANLHYRNVLTDFADQSFGAWKVTQSPVNEGYDPAQYGLKQFDTYGSQPYSLWIEWPPGKKYGAGSWVEIATEI